MTNKEKMEIAANIIISVLSNSGKNTYDRLDAVPDALEKIYNKISELDNANADNDVDEIMAY